MRGVDSMPSLLDAHLVAGGATLLQSQHTEDEVDIVQEGVCNTDRASADCSQPGELDTSLEVYRKKVPCAL